MIGYIVMNYNKEYIKKNINEFNCSPLFIPFASMFGLNPGKNFKKCMTKVLSTKTKGSTNIVNQFTSSIMTILQGVFSSAKNLLKMFTPFTNFIQNIARSFADRFNSIIEVSLFLATKMRDIMSRLLSSYKLIIYSFASTILSLKSTWDGPVGNITRDIGTFGVDIFNFFILLYYI